MAASGSTLRDTALDYLRATGLLEYIRRVERNAGLAERRVESLNQLTQGMAVEDAMRLGNWLSSAALDRREENKEGRGPEVTLMTLHSAKGLEFEEVFLVGFEQELLPHRRSLETGEIAEERRLCYVGMTRAKERLTLTSARTRTKRNERMPRKPSRFLEEIPEALLVSGSQEASSVSDEQDSVGELNRASLARIREMLSK